MSPDPYVPCEWCDALRQVEWIEVTAWGDAESRYVQGRREPCPTKGCGPVCPTCRRPPGDIHKAECATIVLNKLDDRTRVTREDCRPVAR